MKDTVGRELAVGDFAIMSAPKRSSTQVKYVEILSYGFKNNVSVRVWWPKAGVWERDTYSVPAHGEKFYRMESFDAILSNE